MSPRAPATRAWRELDWYETPRYYDAVFDSGTRQEADFLERVAKLHGTSRGRRALEPACGSGRLVLALALRDWRVSGFDRSRAMLRYAQRRVASLVLRPRLIEADLADFRLPGRYDLAHCLVSTFKYLLDERSARAHLTRVAEHLAPGGIYVLGFHLSDYDERARVRERWVAVRGGERIVCNIQSWPPDRRTRLETVRSRLRVERPAGELRSETTWRFRTYDAAQARRLIASVPALEHVATYDFTYDLGAPRELDDSQLDCVLILRRRR